jgi:para-nitrobenzyl esterase
MGRKFILPCIIGCIALFSIAHASKSRPTVTIPTVGKVQGFKASEFSNVIGFTGIRYAEAPIGDLRWAAPKSTSWDNFVAPERIICLQPDTYITPPNVTKSEDCLRINIWVREDVLERTKAGAAPQNGYDS